MTRVLGLYDHPLADGRVLCVDEFGPLNLQPRPGHGWVRRGHPTRRRATYTRTGGVRHMFAALDLASGELCYRFRDRKRWREFLGFCKQLRRRFPTGRLYLICDIYGSHGKAEVTTWCAANNIELVFTTHQDQKAAIARYSRWANRHARPKRHYAANSKIRRPDYLPNVAGCGTRSS